MDKAYPSNLTHKQWKLIEDLLPMARTGGRPRTTNLRAVVDAIFYLNRTGCQWRYLPREFPPWQTVYDYYSKWIKTGVWLKIYFSLYLFLRIRENRNIYPSFAIVDSQSVRAHFGEHRAKDLYKKVIGRKRSILVDTLGFMICCVVHKANDQDFRGLMMLFERLPSQIAESLEKIIGDQSYRFRTLKEEAWVRKIELETLDRKKLGSNMKPKRWIVERTFAWFNHYRRNSRDYEKTCLASETALWVSQIQIIIGRLTRILILTLFRHPPAAKRCVSIRQSIGVTRLSNESRIRPKPSSEVDSNRNTKTG